MQKNKSCTAIQNSLQNRLQNANMYFFNDVNTSKLDFELNNNISFLYLFRKGLGIQNPSYTNINRLLAQVLSSITGRIFL